MATPNPNNTPNFVPDDYVYRAPRGAIYTGHAGYVIASLDNMEMTLHVAKDAIGLSGQTEDIYKALKVLLDNAADVAELLLLP